LKTKIKAGKVLVKIPRRSSKSGDITGGLPRITELLKLVTLQTQL
jgi:DNA-directed RNA polymerase subunit beta'